MRVELVPIVSLSPDPANARKHSQRNIEAIAASLRASGQQTPIVVDNRGIVVKGNGTLEAAKLLGWSDIKIVRTELTGVALTAYAIADNRTSDLAEWDTVALAEQLKAVENEGYDVEATGFTQDEIDATLKRIADGILGDDPSLAFDMDEEEERQVYSSKIQAPIYTPKRKDKPDIEELFDRSKTDALTDEIRAAGLPEPVRVFLENTAQRFTEFNFRNIAEYYCHSDEKVQNLMEKLGLIIIDFDKAIEYGFVHLSDRLSEIVENQLADNKPEDE